MKPASTSSPTATEPVWMEGPGTGRWPALTENLETEVLVVGGGVTGVTAAWLLARAGRRVVLLEREMIGARDSGHTTAHLTYMTDTRLSELVATVGRERARIAWQAGKSAMELIRSAVESLVIDCDFEIIPGFLAVDEDADQSLEGIKLRREAELAKELGFDVEMDGANPVTATTAIRFPGQMRFHPLKYLRALAEDAVKHGVRIFEGTGVDHFENEPQQAKCSGGTVTYQKVVIATHVPLQGTAGTLGAALFQSKLSLYSTYAVAARIPLREVEDLIWSDTAEPFRYLRMERDGDHGVAIFGGEDHKTGTVSDTGACFVRLEEWLTKWLPDAEVTHRWSGQVVETIDRLPYIGESTDNQFIATGFSGNGYTFGTAAAMMALDWIKDLANPWEDAFRPGRKSPVSLKEYVKENAGFAVCMIQDRLGTEEGNPEDLGPGEASVMEHHGERVAAYRDSDGALHVCSAICPHLGCVVAWNPAERTWDCPCHGSRFEPSGRVIAGPAESDLPEVSNEQS